MRQDFANQIYDNVPAKFIALKLEVALEKFKQVDGENRA